MIYLVGGAPRTGKSILGKQVSSHLNIGWISTDLLAQLLRLKDKPGEKVRWDSSPEAIRATADWFFPYLEYFVWWIHSLEENYLVEGVGFLPAQVAQLSAHYPIRCVFLGCSKMTLERFDQFPGRSPGYSFLPVEQRRQFAQEIPLWSEFIQEEAKRSNLPYVDMSDNFNLRLDMAEAALVAGDGLLNTTGLGRHS